MREVKFRAWNKIEKFMDTAWLIDWEHELVCHRAHNQSNLSDCVLMQYTGLKDKEGVEIFEGDVLRVWQEDEYIPNRDSGGGIIDYDCDEGFSQIGKVGFTGCSFDYNTVKTLVGKHEKIHAPIDWINNYEIIGNAYENPELLNKS